MSTTARTRRKRYPVRGFFAGLCLGLGLAIMCVIYGKAAVGTLPPYLIIGLGVVVGVLWAYGAPARTRRGGRRAAPSTPAPPPAEPPPGPPPPYTPTA